MLGGHRPAPSDPRTSGMHILNFELHPNLPKGPEGLLSKTPEEAHGSGREILALISEQRRRGSDGSAKVSHLHCVAADTTFAESGLEFRASGAACSGWPLSPA